MSLQSIVKTAHILNNIATYGGGIFITRGTASFKVGREVE